ncbi:hypothetical protein LTR66_009554 [Elasticomyces elasticus]|nr:hypothetical protein LTR66_009554 [Elasticomyces elasticus]KAK5008144.1 hypothetical protein LTR28_004378 [Elasticomyces elasticus]
MKVTSISLTLLFSTGLVSALPRLVACADDPCYCVDYEKDDDGKQYGGSYDLCTAPFNTQYPKPKYSSSDTCYVTEYQINDCGYEYGGVQLLQGKLQQVLQEAEVQEQRRKWQDEEEFPIDSVLYQVHQHLGHVHCYNPTHHHNYLPQDDVFHLLPHQHVSYQSDDNHNNFRC